MPTQGASSGGASGANAGDIRAGGAYYELVGKDGLSGVLDRVQKKVGLFATLMGRVAKGSAIAGIAIGTPLAALFVSGIGRAADIARLSRQYEVPVELMSRLQYAAEAAGVSVEEVMNDTEGRFSSLVRNAPTIDTATAERALATQRAFRDAILALQAALMPLLTTLTPVVQMVSEFAQRNAGAVRIFAGIAAALVGVGITSALSAVALSGAVMIYKGAIGTVLLLKTGFVILAKAILGAQAAVIMLAKGIISGLAIAAKAVFGVVVSGVTALLSPFGLVLAAIAGIGIAWILTSNIGSRAISGLGKLLRNLGETFGVAWRGIVDAVSAGDLELAFKIAGVGIKAIWYELILALGKGFHAFLEDVHNKLVAIAGIMGAWHGAKLGARFGPWGAVIGGLGGGLIGAGGTEVALSAIKDELASMPETEAKLAALKAELRGLAGRAAVAAKANDMGRPDLDYMRRATLAFDSVKGNFSTYRTAAQQFGYADTVKQQTELQKRIADAAEGTEKGVGKLGDALKMK